MATTDLEQIGTEAADKVTRQMSRNLVAPGGPAFQSVTDFISAYSDKKKTIDDLTNTFVQAQDDIIPHLAFVQSLLSKKGTHHHLVRAARKQGHKIPWWTEFYKRYEVRLGESLRTMERRIAAYRGEPAAPISKPKRDTDPVPRLNKARQKALIEGNRRANELVAALEAGRDGKKEIADFRVVMDAKRLDDILQAHEQEPDYKGILSKVLQTVADMKASLPPAFVKTVGELTKPCNFKITEPALENGKTYLVRHGSRNELHEMSYDGQGDFFIPTGKNTGHAVLAKNAPKVWQEDENGELKPVNIPNKRVFIKKVTR